MTYDAILFDFDGVLADTEPLHYACWRDIAARHGVDLTLEQYNGKLRGFCGLDLVNALRKIPNPPLPESAIEEIYHGKIELFRERTATFEFISAATAALVERAAVDYRLAVVSSARRTHVYPALTRAGISRCFGAIVCRDDVARAKPSPEPYRLAAFRLCAKRPLVIEDSAAGIQSGKAAGFDTVEMRGNLAELLGESIGLG